MDHQSIAIIRKPVDTPNLNENILSLNDKYEYLIIDDGSLIYFYNYTNHAIGGGFDLSQLKKWMIKYFELSTNHVEGEQREGSDFRTPPRPFKFSKRDPEATAYLFEFSQFLVDDLDIKIANGSDKWSQIRWIPENNLKSLLHRWHPDQKFLFDTEIPFQSPKFSKEFRAGIKNVVVAKQIGKLVIFAGAGVSVDSNVPGWSKLIEELKNDLSDEESDFLKVGEIYFQSRGNKEYQEKIQTVLQFGKTNFNPLHKKIIDLKPLHIITTNYDTHFEQVIERGEQQYSVIREDTDLPYSKGVRYILKCTETSIAEMLF